MNARTRPAPAGRSFAALIGLGLTRGKVAGRDARGVTHERTPSPRSSHDRQKSCPIPIAWLAEVVLPGEDY